MATFDNGARVQVRKPHLPDRRRGTVVGETLPCVAESSNSSDRIAVVNI